MKKLLIITLLMAIAGTSAFAQQDRRYHKHHRHHRHYEHHDNRVGVGVRIN